MTKLKTLKDIEPFLKGDEEQGDFNLFSREQLRSEAIKWVKKFRKLKGETKTQYAQFAWEACDGQFRDFFNITEEDLQT